MSKGTGISKTRRIGLEAGPGPAFGHWDTLLLAGVLGALFCLGCSKKGNGKAGEARSARSGNPSYRACSVGDRNVRPKLGVTKLPPLSRDERGYLQSLSRHAERVGVEKAMASAAERIRNTESAALKWFMAVQYKQMKLRVKALMWTNHFLCHYPNVREAWRSKLRIHLALLQHPQIPGMTFTKIRGAVVVGAGGAKSKEEIAEINEQALLSAGYVVRRWPGDADLALTAARIAKKLDEKEKWAAFASVASRASSENQEARLELLRALVANERWKEARAKVVAALKRWPMSPALYGVLARTAKAVGDTSAYQRAQEMEGYYSFFLPELPIPQSAESRKLMEGVSSERESVWKSALDTLVRAPGRRSAAILGGAASRCHSCKVGSASSERCKALIRGLARLGEHGAEALGFLAEKEHTCWMTRRMVHQALARMWDRYEDATLYALMTADQHNMQFFDLIGSLAEAYYPGTARVTGELLYHPTVSAVARLTAIRAHALYLGKHAVAGLERLYANPKVNPDEATAVLHDPPSPSSLRFAAALCLHALTGKESHLDDAEKAIRTRPDKGGSGFLHGELLCLPETKESPAYARLAKWASSDDEKLGPVGKDLVKAHLQWNRLYLYPRRFVGSEGLLSLLEKRCTAKDSTTPNTTTPSGDEGPSRLEPGVACRLAGRGYELTEDLDANRAHAARLYAQGCKLRDGEACSFAGIAAGRGIGMPKSEENAAGFYEKGCKLESWTSCANLGWQYLKGNGVEKSVSKAKRLFLDSCRHRVPLGCHHAGTMYLLGMGVRKDIAKATEYLTKSCKMSYAIDCFNLATIYGRGMGPFDKDEKKASAFLERACELGFKRACPQ